MHIAVYACGCSLSVTCQVAMVKRELFYKRCSYLQVSD